MRSSRPRRDGETTRRRRPAPPGEFALIDRLRRRFASTDASVVRGIGEDAAVIKPPRRASLLLTTDLLAEGVHFDPATTGFEDLGYRAASANLSDIASMGGTPRYLLVALAIPATLTAADVEILYRGMMQACGPFQVRLVGGDTSASRHGLFVSITLVGVIEAGRALRRDGAGANELVYVTGTLGDSRAGLQLLTTRKHESRHAGKPQASTSASDRFLLRRHQRPSARIHEGRWLAVSRLATAAIDVSDGLAGDIRHVCQESEVGVELIRSMLPISRACRSYARSHRLDPADLALAGGEDYELLCTVKPVDRQRFEEEAARRGYRFTCIGVTRPKAFGLRIRTDDGSLQPLVARSYEHFFGPL